MRIAVVGCGSIGKRHLSNLKALGVDQLAAIDTREDRLEEVRDRIGSDIACFTRIDEALAPGCDGVIVGIPTAHHVDAAMAALSAGAHVLIEKPISNRMEAARTLIQAAESKNLTITVGYTYRFWPALKDVKAQLDKGVIGRVYSASIIFSEYLPDWHPWEDYRSWFMAHKDQGGGAVLDESHAIDIMRWLFGEATSVYGINGTISELEIDSDDLAEMVVRFDSRVIGSIHMDIYGRHHRKELAIQGELGNIYWDFYSNIVKVYHADSETWTQTQFEDDRNDMFKAEVAHWLKSIAVGLPPLVDGRDAINTLAIALAAQASSESGKAIVPDTAENAQ